MLLYLLMYLLIGIIMFIWQSAILLIKATKLGCSTEIIRKVNNELETKTSGVFGVIFGWLIWPIRVIQFRKDRKYLLDMYQKAMKESK